MYSTVYFLHATCLFPMKLPNLSAPDVDSFFLQQNDSIETFDHIHNISLSFLSLLSFFLVVFTTVCTLGKWWGILLFIYHFSPELYVLPLTKSCTKARTCGKPGHVENSSWCFYKMYSAGIYYWQWPVTKNKWSVILNPMRDTNVNYRDQFFPRPNNYPWL